MKGKILKVLDVFSQQPLPTFYPPVGARVLCIEAHDGIFTGDPWFEVLYKNKIYAMDMYMVRECEAKKLEPGSLVVLNNGSQAMIVKVRSSQELGTFFTILVDNKSKEISSLEIKEIIESLES
jgi:hypothetical protein